MTARRALALLAALSLLLVGCSDDPEPKMPDPPATSSATPTEEPTETETPEAESAEDFIRRWVEVNTAMQNSGATDEYKALSTRCQPCQQTASRIEDIYSSGGFVKTDGWTIDRIRDRSGSGSKPVYDLEISSSPTTFRSSQDGKVEKLKGGEIVVRVRLTNDAPWQVVQLTQVAS